MYSIKNLTLKIILPLALTLTVLLPPSAFAQTPLKVLVVGTTPINMEAQELQPLLKLAEMEFYAQGATEVQIANVQIIDDNALENMRQQANADMAVSLELTQLKSTVTFFIRASRGGERRFEQISLNNIDEAPIAYKRLVSALLKRKNVEQTATVSTITSAEAKPSNKRRGEVLVGMGVAIGTSINKDPSSIYGVDFRMGYEMSRWRLDLTGTLMGGGSDNYSYYGSSDYYVPQNAGMYTLSVGTAYLFNDLNFSPYVGLGLGFGKLQAASAGEIDGGFGYVSAGLEMFRFYGACLLIDLQMVLPMQEYQYSYSTAYDSPIKTTYTYAPTFKSGLSLLFYSVDHLHWKQ